MRLSVFAGLALVLAGLSSAAGAASLDKIMTVSEVAYAFRKSGFEAAPETLSSWVGKRRGAWVNHVIDQLSTEAVVSPPSWVNSPVRFWGFRELPVGSRNDFRRARDVEADSLRAWWLSQMIATPSPMAERLILMWHNTFVVSYDGLSNRTDALWQHHNTLRGHALGNYRNLLRAMIRDPAVLIYLDNTSNSKNQPNENLARELFEIYTLGDGHYSEQDIKEAARALAGWHINDFGPLEFEISTRDEDTGRKTIFGQSGRFDGNDLVDLILNNPAHAEHLAQKLWLEFISHSEPSEGFIQSVQATLKASNYEMKPVLRAVLSSDYFWDPSLKATSVKSPIELSVGAVRATQQQRVGLSEMVELNRRMGQWLFSPPNVSGWGYGDYWLDPALLVERDRAMIALGEPSMAIQAGSEPQATAPSAWALKGQPDQLVTRELVLTYFTPARPGKGLGVSAMFDGLNYAGRHWDYFGIAFHQDVSGQFRMTLRRHLCSPECLSQWPLDLGKKRMTREAKIYLRPTRASETTFRILRPEDQALVAALVETFPVVLDRVLSSHRLEEEHRREWAARMQGFVDLVNSNEWSLGDDVELVEIGNPMFLSADHVSVNDWNLRIYPRTLSSFQTWNERRNALGFKANLAEYMLSLDLGVPVFDIPSWLRNPAYQIK